MYLVHILYDGKISFEEKLINNIDDLLAHLKANWIEKKDELVETFYKGDTAYIFIDPEDKKYGEMNLRWEHTEAAANMLNYLMREDL